MDELKKSLEERNSLYHETTQRIFGSFSEKLNKAVQYFIKIDRDVQWMAIEFIPGTQNFLYITGFLEIRKGDLLSHSGEAKIEVDDALLDNNLTAKTLVRVMIGINDLESMDAKELYSKIKDYYELSSLIPQEQIIRILGTNLVTDISEVLHEVKAVTTNIVDMVKADDETNINETPELPKNDSMIPTDFDLSVLTEDQIKQLEFYKSGVSKLKN